ncbi:CinA family protein [Corynebacterium tapiri]
MSAADVVAALRAREWSLATCESLTAGRLAATIADVPGASNVLRGGLITYATALKAELAGVDSALLAARGAVDPDVAQAMALGARRECSSDVAVALTGFAGPTGDQVGLVYIAIAHPGGTFWRRYDFSGSREQVRNQAVASALNMLLTLAREQNGTDTRYTG